VFDLYNTLVAGSGRDRRRGVARQMGADLGVDPDRFADLMEMSTAERFVGALGDLATTVAAVAVRAGGRPVPAAVRLACTRRMHLARSLLWPSAPTLAALDALRGNGWRLGLISNCSIETPMLWAQTPLAARFGAVAFSCLLHVAKPAPKIYLGLCAQLAVAPTDCVYVGDGDDDELAGAAAVGMTVLRTEEYIHSGATWPPAPIPNLAALADRLLGSDRYGRRLRAGT
jgi:putative hydrolase of the HAD superfamily